MLSEETAMGNYPVETVQFMSEIASKAEELMAETRRIAEPENDGTAEFLAYAACLLAQKANAKSIVAHSLSGTSARLLSARRPVQTIHALTPDVTSLKALNFSWGVLPHQVGNDDVGHLAAPNVSSLRPRCSGSVKMWSSPPVSPRPLPLSLAAPIW